MLAAVAIFVALGVVIAIFEITRKREAQFDLLFFFNASFFVYYVLAPIHLIFGGVDYATLPNIQRDYFSDQGFDSYILVVAILCALAYFLTLAGYAAAQRCRSSGELPRLPDSVVTAVAIAMASVGLAALAAYLLQFDSVLTPIVQAALIRAGEEQDAGSLAFLRNLIPVVGVCASILFALRLRQHAEERAPAVSKFVIVLFALVSIVALTTQGSRRTLMIYAMEFFFLFANVRNRTYMAPLSAIAIVTLALIFFGDIFSLGAVFGADYIASELETTVTQNFGAVYASFWRDFTYTFQAAVGVVDRYEDLPRLFVDIPLALVDLMPERLLPVSPPEALSAHSTLLLTEIPVPLIAEVPPGYVGYMWYSGYFPGIVIGCFLYGYVGGWAASRLIGPARRDAVWMLIYTYLAFVYGYFIREGIPAMIVTERFHWFLAALVLLAGAYLRRISSRLSASLS
jgi:hypothetical protein